MDFHRTSSFLTAKFVKSLQNSLPPTKRSRQFFLGLVLLPLGFAGGCAHEILQGKMEASQKRETALTAELEEMRQNQIALNAANEELVRQGAEFEKERELAQTEISRLSDEIKRIQGVFQTNYQELTAENDRLRSENQSAEEKIAAQNASLHREATEIIIPNNSRNRRRFNLSDPAFLPPRLEGEDLVVEIQDHLIFDKNNDKLSEEGKDRLRRAAWEISRSYPHQIFRLDGHFSGLSEANLEAASSGGTELQTASVVKAKVIADYLIDACGIPSDQIILSGSGQSRPLVPDSTPEGRKRNRRTDWIIVGGR